METSITSGQVVQLGRFVEDATSKAVAEIRGRLSHIIRNREGAQCVIRRGDLLEGLVRKSVMDILKKLSSVWPVFGTIEVGNDGLSYAGGFLHLLQKQKIAVSDIARGILGEYEVSARARKIVLADVAAGELVSWDKAGIRYKELYDCAKERGLAKLSPEAGPQVLLQLGQLIRPGEQRLIAMNPYGAVVLMVERTIGGDLWLDVITVDQFPNTRWLFEYK